MTEAVRHRYFHSSVITGDWIYIDGGETSYNFGISTPTNITFAIDLSKNWTNSTLDLITTVRPSDALALNYQSLWWSKQNNIVYCFGGERSYANRVVDAIITPLESIWGFSVDGHGSGAWNEVLGPISSPFPPNIIRSAGAATATDDQIGYSLGGFASLGTTPEIQSASEAFNVPGMLSFSFANLSLTNSSNTGYANDQAPKSGSLLQVPMYGVDGILVAMGGLYPNSGVSPSGFNNISIYDTHTGNWYSQTASGDIPEPRQEFCAVGIQDDTDSTYEIFIHGGVLYGGLGQASSDSDQVYVLSLPAFHWLRANYTSTYPRAGHTCHATTTGQMILIGGLDPSQATPGASIASAINGTVDPWNQTIGVFDMPFLEWKKSYDADAEPYTPPVAVKQYYSQGYPSTWTSPGVRALFQQTANTTTSVSLAPTTTSSAVPVLIPSSQHKTSHAQLNSGKIAAIVVGCIVTVAFIVTFTILIRRRGHLRATTEATPLPDFACGPPELQELPTTSRIPELTDNRRSGVELFTMERYGEMLGSTRQVAET
ncbi:hypothetical protein MMC14_007225 [Varicellaria rhodocarpa]|nr:hypothetical protein [Varicellaria rhodocarpa]